MYKFLFAIFFLWHFMDRQPQQIIKSSLSLESSINPFWGRPFPLASESLLRLPYLAKLTNKRLPELSTHGLSFWKKKRDEYHSVSLILEMIEIFDLVKFYNLQMFWVFLFSITSLPNPKNSYSLSSEFEL